MDSPGEFPENHRKEHHEGHKAQHHQGQSVVQHQHGAQHTHDDHGVFGQGYDDVGEHIGNCVGVVGNSRHQLAHGDVVQLLMGELFNVGEHIQADLRQDLLAGLLEDHGLQIGADQRNHQDACIDSYPDEEVPKLKFFFDQTLDVTDDQRGNQIIDDGEDHDEEHTNEAFPVGLGVAEEPPDDLAVGHMPLVVVFLLLMLLQGNVGQDEHQGEGADDGTHDQNGQILTHGQHPLLLPVSGDRPSSDSRGRIRKAPHGYPRQPARPLR